jgi:hypothetical protein
MAQSAEIYIISESGVFFVILNIVNPDIIIIMYHLELTLNSYDIYIYIYIYIYRLTMPSSGVTAYS